TWSVRPHPASVAWAEGQLPTPHGPLNVSWRQGGGQFTVRVSAPRGTSGDVSVPVTGTGSSTGAEVIVNGRVAWSAAGGQAFGATLAGGYVTLSGVPGGTPLSVTVRARS
ncbi:MAG: alpha-L-rhamnosidase C-terminal domain-containing protein, partial [Trebonia sp.]